MTVSSASIFKMARVYKVKKPLNEKRIAKRFLKFLAVNKDPLSSAQVLKNAPESVIKGVCNAAYVTKYDDVHLSPQHRKVLIKHRNSIGKLTTPHISIKKKRHLLTQTGSGFGAIIPIILSAALPLISRLFGSKSE